VPLVVKEEKIQIKPKKSGAAKPTYVKHGSQEKKSEKEENQ
jgi:hypothetical protein